MADQNVVDLQLRTIVREDDVTAVRRIVESTGFFHAYEVNVAVELIRDAVERGDLSDYSFLFMDEGRTPVAYACFGPIACTVGSYDLYWIVVDNRYRGRGIGRRLLAHAEQSIRQRGGRKVYIETSSRTTYDPTRRFYERCGYSVEALLPDFYAPGDGKVIYARTLVAASQSPPLLSRMSADTSG